MGNAEVRAPAMGSHVFEYDNLAWFYNWDDMGIAYAHPQVNGDYYGIINHDNSEGIFRYSDNSTTPGMKFWTWGAEQSFSADPNNFYDNARPYIELWSGFSGQFFEDAVLAPNEIVSWTETYLPTVEITSIQNVSEYGAIDLQAITDGEKRIVAELFMTSPDSLFDLRLSLFGTTQINLLESQFYANADESAFFEVFTDQFNIPDGLYTLKADVLIHDDIVLTKEIPVTFPISGSGISTEANDDVRVLRLSNELVALEFKNPGERALELYNVNGNLMSSNEFSGTTTQVTICNPGIYIIKIIENEAFYTIKVLSN